LLKEALPNLSRLGILFNPDVAATRTRLTAMMEIAPTLGLTTIPVEARGLDALEQAFALVVREPRRRSSCREIACCSSIAARLQKWL
jgi:putative ABC transport system substrate-binding protein